MKAADVFVVVDRRGEVMGPFTRDQACEYAEIWNRDCPDEAPHVVKMREEVKGHPRARSRAEPRTEMAMTNEERASVWLHANWPSHQVWSGDVAAALTALLDAVDREARVIASNESMERVREADRLFVRYGLAENEDVVAWASGGQPVLSNQKQRA